jgi:hypothetical protein
MKNLLTVPLPALALLALSGCATSGALTTSTENDGVYYSSSDHTTAVAPPARVYNGSGNIPARSLDDTVPAATTDDANPDYQGGTGRGYASGSDYYSNSYNDGLSYYNPSGFNQPYTGPGVSSYNYNPGWAVAPSAYGSPFGYGAGLAVGYSYSPYAMGGYGYPYGGLGYGYPYGGGFYDSFYSPYYSPWGYGSGLSIGFGYGFGGFGYPYGGYGGYPYGYGYGRGYRGYYDSYGYGAAAGRAYSSPRVNRGGGSVFNGATPMGGSPSGGRPVGSYSPSSVAMPNGTPTGGGMTMPTRRDGGGGGNVVGQPAYSTPGNPTGSANPNPRRGFFGGFFGNGSPAGQNAAGSPNANPRGSWSQPQSNGGQATQPQRRDFGGQPAYQPQQRSYSPPSQSQPSRSFGGGSFGGGGGGGGGFGGGGGGGRRGGR